MRYVATNIRLPRETLDALKIKAVKSKKSLAGLIRDAIEQTYHIGHSPTGARPADDPFHRLIGAWESGSSDGASKHDRDIYGVDE